MINTCMIVINYRASLCFISLSLCHIRIKIISMAVCLFYACVPTYIEKDHASKVFDTLDCTPTIMLCAIVSRIKRVDSCSDLFHFFTNINTKSLHRKRWIGCVILLQICANIVTFSSYCLQF